MEVDQARRCSGRWSGGDEAVDIVLRIGRFLVAVDVVMARFAQGLRFVHLIDQMKPVKIVPALFVCATATALVIEVSLRAVAKSPPRKFVYVVAAKAEIEIGRVKARRAGKRILVIRAPDAPVRRTVWPHRR